MPSPITRGGDSLSTHDEKLQRLLDGEIDEAEIASDPVLSSLAERIFGLVIEPITPSKPSQMNDISGDGSATDGSPMMSMVEVIPGAIPAPLPNISPVIETPVNVPKKSRVFSKFIALSSLIISTANVFGAFGFLNSNCTAVKCTDSATRINWIDVYNIGNEQGWSLPFPTMGIPDYVAVGCSLVLILLVFKRK